MKESERSTTSKKSFWKPYPIASRLTWLPKSLKGTSQWLWKCWWILKAKIQKTLKPESATSKSKWQTNKLGMFIGGTLKNFSIVTNWLKICLNSISKQASSRSCNKLTIHFGIHQNHLSSVALSSQQNALYTCLITLLSCQLLDKMMFVDSYL